MNKEWQGAVVKVDRLINIGFNNTVNVAKIVAVIKPEAAPVKRLVALAKDESKCYDATCGRKCKSVIVIDGGAVVLSSLLPETITNRVNNV